MTPAMAFLGGAIGPAELLVIMIAILLLWGPHRLPGMARKLGHTMEKLRHAADELKEQVLHADQEVTTPQVDAPPDTPAESRQAIPSTGMPPDGSTAVSENKGDNYAG